MNAVFRLDLYQYTHLVVCPLSIVRRLKVRTDSHAFQAEALIKMIKSGCSYVQVGVRDNFQLQGRKSKAFKLKNVVGVATSVLLTIWDVYVTRDLLAAPTRPATASPQAPASSRASLHGSRERVDSARRVGANRS